MAYSPLITHATYDLNSSLFLELVREVLQVEFLNQRNNFAQTFLPKVVKKDEYLLNPVADTDIDPAFCSVIKAKSQPGDNQFHGQSSELNTYVIGILADGLENLRKIADAAYIILNDMDVKNYFFNYKNTDGDQVVTNSGKYKITALSTEFEVMKTMNDKNIIYGFLILEAEIGEKAKFNLRPTLKEIDITISSKEQGINFVTE